MNIHLRKFSNTHLHVGSNWFLLAKKNNLTINTIRIALLRYWKDNNQPIDYYIFHLLMYYIVNNIICCKKEFEKMPYFSNQTPHILQSSFKEKFDEDVYANILSSCFVHKLTYKGLLQFSEDSILKHFLRENL